MTQQHRDTIWNGLISSGECFLLSPNEIDHVLSGRVLLADIPTRDPDAVSTFAKHVAYTLRGRLQFPISQDLFDELFSLIRLRILESIPKYRPGRASDAGYISWGFKAYLYNFAIKTAYQDFRKEYHEARRVPEDEDTFLSDTLSYTPEEPEDGLLSKALDSAVASVLDDSPGSAAYCLYNVAGLSIPEISSILGITQKSCYKFLEKISLKITKKVRESILVSNCYNTAA